MAGFDQIRLTADFDLRPADRLNLSDDDPLAGKIPLIGEIVAELAPSFDG